MVVLETSRRQNFRANEGSRFLKSSVKGKIRGVVSVLFSSNITSQWICFHTLFSFGFLLCTPALIQSLFQSVERFLLYFGGTSLHTKEKASESLLFTLVAIGLLGLMSIASAAPYCLAAARQDDPHWIMLSSLLWAFLFFRRGLYFAVSVLQPVLFVFQPRDTSFLSNRIRLKKNPIHSLSSNWHKSKKKDIVASVLIKCHCNIFI